MAGRRRRRIVRKQRGRGKGKDKIFGLMRKVHGLLKKQMGTKSGRGVVKKLRESVVKAGIDIALRKANPKSTIKRTLKEGGKTLTKELLRSFV